jgi:dihydrofolate synthase / folylpolyglutamate synthase
MKVTAYKTHKIEPNENLLAILDKYLPPLEENSVVAIASKIVGICEGRVVKKTADEQKNELIKQEADAYLPSDYSPYGFIITIKNGALVASSGIDESNTNDNLSLWPADPQDSANKIREYLTKKHKRNNLGVILTDSRLTPLRWGVTGFSISHSGFLALNNYIGKSDIFGRTMRVEQSNIADSLATAAVAVMGEGDEQQPLSVITDVPFVQFQQRNPTKEELEALQIKPEDDFYAPLLTSVPWEKKKKSP